MKADRIFLNLVSWLST